jgi:hypothetical protein
MRRRRSFARKTWLVAIAALVVVGVATAATRSSTADYSARNIADIVLIDQHESRYTHLADSHRFKEWSELWTENGVLDEAWQDANGDLHPINGGAGCKLTGRAEIEQFITTVFGPSAVKNLPRPAAGLGHRIVNRLIEVNGDTATLKAYGPNSTFQYENTLARTKDGPDGGWKFTRVFIIFNADRTAPCTANGPVSP